METYIIFSRNLAYQLRLAGFRIIKTEPNKNKPEWDCYFFKDTPTFREALTSLTQGGKKHEE